MAIATIFIDKHDAPRDDCKVRIDFEETMYGFDFEAFADLGDVCSLADCTDRPCFLRLKAYDTSLCENDEDKKLYAENYLFNCEVEFFYEEGEVYDSASLAKKPARDLDDALRVFAEILSDGDAIAEKCIAVIGKHIS